MASLRNAGESEVTQVAGARADALVERGAGWASYTGFGLHIRTNMPIGLPAANGGEPDLLIARASQGRVRRALDDAPEGWAAIETDIGVAIVAKNGRLVLFAPETRVPDREALAFLLRVVMLQVLSHRKVLCLHGSAVRLGSAALAFVGSSGSGKSTIAASLMKAGGSLLADDLLPVVGGGAHPVVMSTCPMVSLWEDCVPSLGGDIRAAVPAPRREGKYIFADSSFLGRFSAQPTPLRRLYFLRRAAAGGRPAVEEDNMAAAERLVQLIPHVPHTPVPSRRARRWQFEAAALLSESASVRYVNVPVDLGALAAVAGAILRDCGAAAAPAGAEGQT